MINVLCVNIVDPISEVENRYPPLWPAYLAAYADRTLGEGRVDFRVVTKGLEQEIESYKPHIVALGSVSQNFALAKQQARVCKERGLPVVIGGPHISLLPECLTRDMDVGCIGEGEQTFSELLELFLDQGRFTPDALSDIAGIAYHEDGRVKVTPRRELIRNLDDVPHPKRSLIGYGRDPYIIGSRGCPYKCTYCASSRFWKTYRVASADYAVEEIVELAVHGSRLIRFNDDLFMSNRTRVEKIITGLEDQGLLGKIAFSCSLRANLVTKELAALLKRMNVASVTMGLESGSNRVLASLKGGVTVEQNEAAVNSLKDAGIQSNAFFVIGAPDETEDEIMQTYRFIKRSRLDFVGVYVLVPLPGTPIWDFAAEKGLVSADMDWTLLNMNFEYNADRLVIVSQNLTRDEIKHLYRKFRRQRLYRILKALPSSPWLWDIPRVALGDLLERMRRLVAKA
ncbi:MAG: radical SAM protein [Desulfomonile tiedjei]|nr:radical SAM protein [Desulfomonile tiedjei]